MSEPDPSPKWRRRKEARPAEIVAAAYEVFAEKGFASARLDEIAARAGVSKGALYLYFETKQDIFEAVVRDAVGANFDAIEAMAANYTGRLEDLLRMMIPRMAGAVAASPIGKVLKMVIGESGNFPDIARVWHDTVILRGLGLISGLIERAQKRGEIRAGDPRNFAATLISPLVVGLIFRETFAPVGGQPFNIPKLMDQHLDTVLPGLLAPPKKEPQKTEGKKK